MAGPKSHRGRRAKGSRGEREFFSLLNKFLPERLRIERDLSQSRDGGSDGKSAGLVIEVKRQENLRLGAWLTQVRSVAENSRSLENPKGSVPVLVYRQNNQPWRCLVELTPVQLAAYMRYKNNLDDTVNNIERNIGEL